MLVYPGFQKVNKNCHSSGRLNKRTTVCKSSDGALFVTIKLSVVEKQVFNCSPIDMFTFLN